LSTQAVSASLRDEAAQKGIRLDAVPFIRTELLEAGELPAGPGIAVFTSQHAVEALPAIGQEWTVYCIEGATRRLVEERFGTGIIAGTASSAEELAKKIIESNPGQRVVFFCGDLRRQELPVLLRGAGLVVEERIVYRTVLTPQRVEGVYDGIVFFSPSAVESFFSANSISGGTVCFAIGRTTAAAVRARTGREAIIAGKPDKEVLIHEMITHFTV
jgi:uroporphyrinogen-III synthase